MLFYPAALPLSSQTLLYVAGVIRRHRKKAGSCWRKLNPGRQALLVLAYLRKGETLIPIDRVAADRPFYSGKHRRHGMNLQVISAPDGEILWVSGPLPGAVHDLTAARIWGIIRDLAAAGLIVLADKGYHGAGDQVLTPYRGRNKPASQKAANRAHMPSYDPPASAPTPSSRPGTYCENSAAAHGAPGSWPRPSMSFKPARSQDEKAHWGTRIPRSARHVHAARPSITP